MLVLFDLDVLSQSGKAAGKLCAVGKGVVGQVGYLSY